MKSEYCEKLFPGTLGELHARLTEFQRDLPEHLNACGCQLAITDCGNNINFSMEISCPTERDDDIPAFVWMIARRMPRGIKVVFKTEMYDYRVSPHLQEIYKLLTTSEKVELKEIQD